MGEVITGHDIFEERFGKSQEFNRYDRGLDSYRMTLFSDDLVQQPPGDHPCAIISYDLEGNESTEKIDSRELRPIDGGFKHFVEDADQLLDLGSGSGRAIDQMAQINPRGRFYGVDIMYAKERPTYKIQNQNAKLVSATWFELPFAPESFDRISSMYSFPYHLGRSKSESLSDEQLTEKAISEITRVSKKNAIWRGSLSSATQSLESWASTPNFHAILARHGWKLTVIDKGDSETFIAELTNKA